MATWPEPACGASTVFLFSGRLGGGLADSECDFEWTFVVFFALDSFFTCAFFSSKIDSLCSHNCHIFSSTSVLLYGAEQSIRARELGSGAMV